MNDIGKKVIGGVIKNMCLYISLVCQLFTSEIEKYEKEVKKNK